MKKFYFSILIISILSLSDWNSSVFAQATFPVPNIPGCSGVNGVIVNMRGQGGSTNGGGTPGSTGAVGVGGYGGAVVCTLNVYTPTIITSLTYYVGMQGAAGSFVPTGTTGAFGGTGYGTGGNGGNFVGPTGGVGNDLSGGAGGGSSAVLNTTGSVLLFVTGGGGGGGTQAANTNGGFGGNPGTNGQGYAPYNYGGPAVCPAFLAPRGGNGLNNNGIAAGAAAPGNGGNGGVGQTGSQSGGGGGAGYGGGGGGGAGNTNRVGTLDGVNTPSAAGGGGANYVSPTCVTTGLTNGTASALGNGAVTLTLYPAAIGGTCISLCPGTTTTFTEATTGGVWSSSNNAVASVSPTAGSPVTVTAGVSAGTADISYLVPGGYWAFVTVTVLAPASPVTGPAIVCQGNTITLSDAVAGGVWNSGNPTIATVTPPTGIVTGVSAGIANITYTAPGGCPATYTVSVTTQPNQFSGATVCAGNSIVLSDAPSGGNWSSSNTSVATIDPVTGSGTGVSAGTSTVTYSFGGTCYTTNVVTVNPLPVISGADSTNPDSCGVADGKIVLNGLTPGTLYSLVYNYNGTPVPAATFTAPVTITSLDSGTYLSFVVTDATTGCSSAPFGPVTLSDPPNPPAPVITSNQPICDYKTLLLTARDAWSGGYFTWTGPNDFTSNIIDPTILAATYADSGIYAVTYTVKNCISLPGTADVIIEPIAPLTNVTLSQTILYGSSIQLNADNALYYTWKPDDGTINNPNINNPIAIPVVTTTYVVYGLTQFGCLDSAFVTITVDSNMNAGIPTAFTPNGDGLNDVFRPVGIKYQRLVEFRVYNRWGQQVFHSNDAEHGWDGTVNGVPQDMGVYYYQIIIAKPGGVGEDIVYKGDVTLIR